MLQIKKLSKFYGTLKALNEIDLTIERGSIVGLFGANGSGKTTLIKSILGLTSFNGSVLLDGCKVGKNNIETFSLATAEHSFFQNLTAKEHLEFYEMHFRTFRRDRFDRLLSFFMLPPDKKIKTFSLGQKNQFEVLLSLSQGADYIFMDEPFATSDILHREDFYKLLLGLREERESLILSTHLVEEVESVVDRALVLDRGKLILDVRMEEIEAKGSKLVKEIKACLNYKADRVGQMIGEWNPPPASVETEK